MPLVHESETYEILGACFEVYRQKGCGFLESVFQECLEIELQLRGIPTCAQKTVALEYKGVRLRHGYVADFVCFERVLVEIKAVSTLADEHRAQVQNYLHATGLHAGLLINFGHYPRLQHERFVL